MSAGFTSGNWFAASHPSSVVGWPVVASPQGRSICSVSWMPGLPDEMVEEIRANAKLIAAAPALYAALNLLRDEMTGVDSWWGDLHNAVDKADDALAKARGES